MAITVRSIIRRTVLILTVAVVGVGTTIHSGPTVHAAGRVHPPCLPCPKAPMKAPRT
jgi:hypothetical protein